MSHLTARRRRALWGAGGAVLTVVAVLLAARLVAAHSTQLNGKVAAVGSLTINLDPDGSCTDGDTGATQNYGPFPLLDVDPGAQGPYATWNGTITNFGDQRKWAVVLRCAS